MQMQLCDLCKKSDGEFNGLLMVQVTSTGVSAWACALLPSQKFKLTNNLVKDASLAWNSFYLEHKH